MELDKYKEHIATLEATLAEGEGREASLCDLLNSWARESGVQEAARPEEAKGVADRLRMCWVAKVAELKELLEHC